MTRLSQALLNYVGNATKFTECGNITLRARRMAESDERIELRFEVEDSGIGIAPDRLPHVFDAFPSRRMPRSPVNTVARVWGSRSRATSRA